MRKLEDLKEALLRDEVDRFYIFYGEDVGIRKHYVDKISTYSKEKFTVDDWVTLRQLANSNSLFPVKRLALVFNDMDFLNQKPEDVQNFIDRINADYTCIFIYDDTGNLTKTPVFKNFEQYITEFQSVQLNIAKEFIESELDDITETDEEEMAYNCDNLYNNILLEADKIRQYQDSAQISQQGAYEALKLKNQLLHKDKVFSCEEFMNSVLSGQYTNIAQWCEILNNDINQGSIFKYLQSMFDDFQIAGLCAKYGSINGSSRAYQYGLFWGRAKCIRELDLSHHPYEYYFDCAYKISQMDSLVKSGKLEMTKTLNYFLANVI